MTVIESTIAPHSDAYKANRDGMLALISRMRSLEERARAASAAAKDRFHKRGQLLPRERVALVLDPGSSFLELSTLAGFMFDVPDADKSIPGGGLIAGIGFVSGVRCMVSASDSGIDAGALQPYGLDKTLRVQELALENKLPYVQLVESAAEEELGGAEMHTSISGLGDYLAEDDRDALRIARDIMANLEWDRPST